MIVIQVITFMALVFILKKLMYTEASKELKRLQRLTQESARKVEELARKTEESEKQCKEKLSNAEREAKSLTIKAYDEAEKVKEEMLEKARRESERIIRVASNAKKKIRQEAVLRMREKLPELGSRIFKDVLFPAAREVTHQELIREVTSEIEKIEKSRFDFKIDKGELVSAYPLKKDEKNKLLSCIFQKLGYEVSFDEKEDESLVAGVVIKLNTLVIDGSLNNRLKRVEEKLKDANYREY